MSQIGVLVAVGERTAVSWRLHGAPYGCGPKPGIYMTGGLSSPDPEVRPDGSDDGDRRYEPTL